MVIPTARPLTRILGLGFGLAIAFGGTVGVGILRLPGTLAEHPPVVPATGRRRAASSTSS